MRALTVRQPFASWIVGGHKTIENRTQQTHVRGRIVIHAGKELHDRFADFPTEFGEPRYPRAAIVGTVQLVGCHLSTECSTECRRPNAGAEWFHTGELTLWHWELGSPREFVTPIPRVRGALGFWRPTESDSYLIDHAEVSR